MPGPSDLELRPVVEFETDFAEAMTEEGAAIHERNRQRLEGD